MKDTRRAARLGVALIALAASLASAAPAPDQEREVRIGVRASSGVEAAHRQWDATAAHLTAAIPGVRFVLEPMVQFSDLERAVAEGRLDLVLTNPLVFIQLQQAYGLEPVATLRNTRLAGGRVSFSSVIFTRDDRRDILRLDDLRGRSIMGVHVHSCAGWLMARAALAEHGIDPFRDCSRVLFAASATQEEVVRAVLAGDVDAGTVRTGIIEDMLERGEIPADALRILEPVTDNFPLRHTTGLYPEWPLAAAAHLDDGLVETVRNALLNIEIDSAAARDGGYTGWILPLDYASLHETLKEFNLPPYEDYGRATWEQIWRLYRTTILVVAAVLALVVAVAAWVFRLNRLLRSSQSALLKHRQDLEHEIAERTASLAASEARYRNLAAVAPVGIFHADRQGMCTYFSPFWERLTGFPASTSLGDGWTGTIHPEDRERVVESWLGMVGSGVTGPLEFRIVDADENVRWVMLAAEPQHDADGRITGYIGCVNDLSDRHAAEEELHRLAEAIFQTSDAVVITDAAGAIQYLNPAYEALSGHEVESAVGRDFDLLMSGGGDPAVRREMWDALHAGGPWRGRTRLRRHDGEERRVAATVSPVMSDKGDLVSIVTVCKDISRAERLERQLRQSQKMEAVGQLAGGIAHDFNNIIQAILGNVEFASEGLAEGSARRRELGQIETAAKRAAALTRQLLAFSRRQVIEPAAIDLHALIENILPLVRTVLSADIELDYRPGDGLAPVLADASQIEQVLMNLCLNSRDSMPRGGTLTIATGSASLDAAYREDHPWAEPGDYTVLEVADTGEGMDEDTRQQVFEPFFSTKEVGKGTGLGLATVYGIVQQHAGLIQLESIPGEGTTVRVYLPPAPESAVVPEPPAPRSQPAAATAVEGRETILLAEDDENVLDATSRILERFGYTVIPARDGQEALDLFAHRGDDVDLCILDLVMPRLGGREVARAIRGSDPAARLMFVSGYDPDAVAARAAGASDGPVLTKPVPMTDLLTEVRRILDSPAD